MFGLPIGYISGLGRSVPQPRVAHLYKGTLADPGWPMCRFGWNRDDGESYSIWRNNFGSGGVCRICLKRAEAGLDGVPPKGYDPNATTEADDLFCPPGCPACDFVRSVERGDATWADLDKIDASGVKLLCNAGSSQKGVSE